MSSEYATTVRQRRASRRGARREPARVLAVQLIGPLTILAGCAWAFLQPHRLVFLDTGHKGLWDYLVEPPLLVIAVGLIYAVLLAPGLVEDIEAEDVEEEPGGTSG